MVYYSLAARTVSCLGLCPWTGPRDLGSRLSRSSRESSSGLLFELTVEITPSDISWEQTVLIVLPVCKSFHLSAALSRFWLHQLVLSCCMVRQACGPHQFPPASENSAPTNWLRCTACTSPDLVAADQSLRSMYSRTLSYPSTWPRISWNHRFL